MKRRFLLAILLAVGLAACASTWETAIPAAIYPLATPYSDVPAAGICAEAEDPVVVVTIHPDIPDPRCTRVRPDQTLKVVNQTDGQIQILIGTFEATLEPGAAAVFDVPFGEYLAPGVHLVQVQPCCSPTLWLESPSP
jgi:hypothetical protein